jgi:hypothetical protein
LRYNPVAASEWRLSQRQALAMHLERTAQRDKKKLFKVPHSESMKRSDKTAERLPHKPPCFMPGILDDGQLEGGK